MINSNSIIPSISISVDSGDDEQIVERRESKKKKKSWPTNDHRRDVVEEETDQEDDSIESRRADHKRENYRTNRMNSSSNETSTPIPTDDDPTLARKQSKIGRSILFSIAFSSLSIVFQRIIDGNYVRN